MKNKRICTIAMLTALLTAGIGGISVHAEESALPAETIAAAATTTIAETTETAAVSTSAAASSTVQETTTTATATTTAAEKPAAGWEQKNGKRCYRMENGEYAQGVVTIDGIPYLFGYSGAQKTDWQTVDGKRRYYHPETGEAAVGWLDYFGNRYYLTAEDGKITDRTEIGGKQYCFSEEGTLQTGIFSVNGGRLYADASGELKAGKFDYYGDLLLTDANGTILTGWQTFEEALCYADPDTGFLQSGRFCLASQEYYLDPKTFAAQEGQHVTAEGTLLTDKDGRVLTGWQELDGKRYFAAEDTGFVQYGMFQADELWYFGTEDGLAAGVREIDGERMCFSEETGALVTGWFTEGEKRYYLDPASLRCCKNGFFRINDDIYYFTEDGSAGAGIVSVSGNLFGLDETGKRLSGYQSLGGANYYFDPENGYALAGARTIEGGTVRFGQDGKQVFGWQKLGEDYYYTDPVTGFVLPGDQIVDGVRYTFDENGKYLPDIYPHPGDGRLYDQNDPYWDTVQFNEKSISTMKASGCGIFSFCNAIYALNGNKADAVEVARWAISIDAYRPGNGGTMRDKLYANIESRYGAELGFRQDGPYKGTIEDARLKEHLMNGGVAIIHVYNHFMAAVGYDPYTGLYHVLESCESQSRQLMGDSWVTADKLSAGSTKVDWYVLLSRRY